MVIENEGPSTKMDVDGELFPQIGTADIKPVVGYVYDIMMMMHHNRRGDHDEDPERICAIFSGLKEAGCVDLMKKVECQPATREDILTVHTADHWDRVMAYSCR